MRDERYFIFQFLLVSFSAAFVILLLCRVTPGGLWTARAAMESGTWRGWAALWAARAATLPWSLACSPEWHPTSPGSPRSVKGILYTLQSACCCCSGCCCVATYHTTCVVMYYTTCFRTPDLTVVLEMTHKPRSLIRKTVKMRWKHVTMAIIFICFLNMLRHGQCMSFNSFSVVVLPPNMTAVIIALGFLMYRIMFFSF